MSKIQPEDVAAWRACVGRVETTVQFLDPTSLRRFLAVLGESAGADPTIVPRWRTGPISCR